MNKQAFDQISELLTRHNADFNVYTHRPCGPSEESKIVRKEAGIPDAIGAKAILSRFEWRDNTQTFVALILPGDHKIDKQPIKQRFPNLRQFSFATQEEMLDIAGVAPGCMPPFGNQIFPKINALYICESLSNHDLIAFNAAYFERTITVPTHQYLALINKNDQFLFSIPK